MAVEPSATPQSKALNVFAGRQEATQGGSVVSSVCGGATAEMSVVTATTMRSFWQMVTAAANDPVPPASVSLKDPCTQVLYNNVCLHAFFVLFVLLLHVDTVVVLFRRFNAVARNAGTKISGNFPLNKPKSTQKALALWKAGTSCAREYIGGDACSRASLSRVNPA